jgi:glycosyltransferase involved in cell wall biosynthesis
LVLCGSDKGNLKYINTTIHKLGLTDFVLFLGFISNEEMYALYYNATALIMASWFGPTNMPPIEAMEIGCPVICSDIAGHSEILGDAALYFDPFDDNSLIHAMNEMTGKYEEFKRRIGDQNSKSIFKIENSMKLINRNMKRVAIIRRNWL